MRIKKNGRIFYFTLFLALLYAFIVRSAFQFVISGTVIQKYLFYTVIFTGLICCLFMSFDKNEGHLYAPNGFYSIFVLFLVISIGLSRNNELNVLLYYGIALLVPFTLLPQMKESAMVAKILGALGIFLAIGCVYNYFFPLAYNLTIRPLFSTGNLASILESERIKAGRNTVAGFTSNVGYTSFFITTCLGAVFCFRKKAFLKTSLPIMLFMIFGLLLTGKRGPLVFLAISIIVVYFIEGYGRDKVYRVIKMFFALVLLYLVLMIMAKSTNSDGIVRIFETINNALKTGEVDNSGRTQLYNQAWEYFYESPVFGIGWNYFKTKYTFRGTYVHNIYLQLLCETGIVGFSIFIIFFASRIMDTLRKLNSSKKEDSDIEFCWMKFSLFIQVYFLLYGITGNPLYDTEETIIYFFAVGISFLPMIKASKESNQIE